MTLKELLEKQGLEEEQIQKILDSMKENKIYTTEEENIEERYSKLKDQKTELETQLSERDEQLEDLSKKAKGNEELEAQLQELKDLNQNTKEEYENKLEEQNFNYALDVALRDNKVKNTKAVQALLDKDTIKLDGDKLLGLDEQIKTLKESESYLFEDEAPSSTGGSGNFGRNKNEPDTNDLGSALSQYYGK